MPSMPLQLLLVPLEPLAPQEPLEDPAHELPRMPRMHLHPLLAPGEVPGLLLAPAHVLPLQSQLPWMPKKPLQLLTGPTGRVAGSLTLELALCQPRGKATLERLVQYQN